MRLHILSGGSPIIIRRGQPYANEWSQIKVRQLGSSSSSDDDDIRCNSITSGSLVTVCTSIVAFCINGDIRVAHMFVFIKTMPCYDQCEIRETKIV